MFDKIRKVFSKKKEEPPKEKSDMDYLIESATWFCSDFNLSPEKIEQLCIKIKAVEAGASRAITKVVREELADHLSTWKKGTKILSDREEEIGGNVGDLAGLVASHINKGMRSRKQRDRIERVMEHLPYCIIERGPVFHDCPVHHKYTGMIILADDVFWQTHPMNVEWECDCRVRQISERQKEKIQNKD